MPVDQELYAQVKDDLATISGPLFDLAEKLVRQQGAFLPFGAVLADTGEVSLQAAAPENDLTTSTEVLPSSLTLSSTLFDPARQLRP